MKNKILITTILAALLMVSMPFVSMIQAATAPISMTATSTLDTIQTLKDKAQDITSVQEATSTLLQIKMSTFDPEAQSLASQTIALISTNSIDCENLALLIDAADILAAIAWSSYESYGTIGALVLALTYDAMSAVFSFFYAIFCARYSSSSVMLSSTNILTPVTISRTCSICAQ